MDKQNADSQRDALLRRALVPKGFRPTKIADIEKMLDVIADEPISEEKVQRMLRKVNGQEPIFVELRPQRSDIPEELSETEQALCALHRSKKEPLPPKLAAKIKAMEERTRNISDSEQGPSGG
jgi:DNA-directed RNA polymerase specialized sigma subunit